MRKTCALTLAVVMVALLGTVTSCTTDREDPWSGADLFVVTGSGDDAVLTAIDSGSASVARAGRLSKLADIPSATYSVVHFGKGKPLLEWSDGSGPRGFAWVDPSVQRVTTLSTRDDGGVVGRVDDELISVKSRLDGTSEVSRISLNDGRLLGRQALALPVTVLAAGQGESVVLGSTARDGIVAQWLVGGNAPTDPVVVVSRALPGNAAVARSGVVVALNRTVPEDVSPLAKANFPAGDGVAVVNADGEVRTVTGAESPYTVSKVAEDAVAFDGMVKGRRAIQLLDVASTTITRTVPLVDPAPVQGIVTVSGARIAVLQANGITLVELSTGETTTIPLPDGTETLWRST